MFFDGTADGGVLTPLVYVPRANTCFWEHSCASGTSAAAMYLAHLLNSRIDASFEEPGGILAVTSEPAGQTWLKGSVRIVSDHEL
jgi:diaminopimelate epimerase